MTEMIAGSSNLLDVAEFVLIGSAAKSVGRNESVIYYWATKGRVRTIVKNGVKNYYLPDVHKVDQESGRKKRKGDIFVSSAPPKMQMVLPEAAPLTERPLTKVVSDDEDDHDLAMRARKEIATGLAKRAKACEDAGKHEAAKELLWMCVDALGVKV